MGSRGTITFFKKNFFSMELVQLEDFDLRKQHCENLTSRNVRACLLPVYNFSLPYSAVSCEKAVLLSDVH